MRLRNDTQDDCRLDDISALKAQKQQTYALESVVEKALDAARWEDFPFEKALRKQDIAFMYARSNGASPSKGLIAEDFQLSGDRAGLTRLPGADAVSVLTEPDYFLGSADYLRQIRAQVGLPLLRKDFVIDEYQLYDSKLIGADAVLLICALLDTAQLQKLSSASAIFSASLPSSRRTTRHEVQSAIAAGARVIGVNNRNLKHLRGGYQ